MKALLNLYNSLSFEIEGDKLSNILEEISDIEQAVAWEPCGKCKSVNTFPNHRKVEDDSFYELKCKECGAVLQLGVHKKGGKLYKKKMQVDADGKAVKVDNKAVYLPDNGWLKWNPVAKQME